MIDRQQSKTIHGGGAHQAHELLEKSPGGDNLSSLIGDACRPVFGANKLSYNCLRAVAKSWPEACFPLGLRQRGMGLCSRSHHR